MTEDQIKYMVQRFLSWKLPEKFNPDNGISFDPIMNKGYAFESRREPVGTNLLDADQTEMMVRYMVDGMSYESTPDEPESSAPAAKKSVTVTVSRALLESIYNEFLMAISLAYLGANDFPDNTAQALTQFEEALE